VDRSDISDKKPFKIYRKDDHWIEERHGEETRRHRNHGFFGHSPSSLPSKVKAQRKTVGFRPFKGLSR